VINRLRNLTLQFNFTSTFGQPNISVETVGYGMKCKVSINLHLQAQFSQ